MFSLSHVKPWLAVIASRASSPVAIRHWLTSFGGLCCPRISASPRPAAAQGLIAWHATDALAEKQLKPLRHFKPS
jgi:hypothetical protein